MLPRLSDAPELAEIRLELAFHQRFAHAIAGDVCDTCHWLNRLEEDLLEADLAHFGSTSRTAA